MSVSAQQQQLYKILEDLLKLPENRECADCGTKAPRWASTNIGVFICIRCSGIHRAMGVHISKVKSVSLDKWTPELVEVMQSVGNAKAKEIYEANVNGHNKGDIKNDNLALEQWIRDKYEHKRFMKRDYESRPVVPAHSSHSHSHHSHHPHSHHSHPPQREAAPQPLSRPRAPSGGSSSRPRGPSGGSSSLPAPVFAPAQPKAAPKPVSAKQASTPAVADLLNWDEPQPAPAAPAPAATSSDAFGDFVSNTPSDTFGDFVTATPEKPSVDKSSIMSLFHPPMAPVANIPTMPGYPPYGIPQSYPQPNYNVHGLGVPGSLATHPQMPPGMPPQMMQMPPGGGMGMPPPGYPPYGAVPAYPVPGGVPGYYGAPNPQMGVRPF